MTPLPGVYSSFVAGPSFLSFGTILVPQQPSPQPHSDEKMVFSLDPIPPVFLFSFLSVMIIPSAPAGLPGVSILFELIVRHMDIKVTISTKVELRNCYPDAPNVESIHAVISSRIRRIPAIISSSVPESLEGSGNSR